MENGLVNLGAIVGLIVGACGLVPVLFFLGNRGENSGGATKSSTTEMLELYESNRDELEDCYSIAEKYPKRGALIGAGDSIFFLIIFDLLDL